ncbi:MAG: hypothetical protein P4M11_07675 [Candidatus Pacebacteria bacterium]|nr:hypothetical protein [Candidatus Paceibacterota bacterium]
MGTGCYSTHKLAALDLASNFTAIPEEESAVPVMRPRPEPPVPNTLASSIHEFHTHSPVCRGRIQKTLLLPTPDGRHDFDKVSTCYGTSSRAPRRSVDFTKGRSLCVADTLVISMPRTMVEESKNGQSVRSAEGISTKLSLNFTPIPAQFRCENKHKLEERYEVLEMIGKGGFGEVRKIRDNNTKDIRALKTMLKAKCQAAKEFSEEIQILQRLVHFR